MFKKSADMAYTSERINSPKWLLGVCAVASALVDVVIIVMLAMGGMGAKYLACPIVLFIFDAVYLIVSLFFTNFRFKYSLAVWISYVAVFSIGLAIGSAAMFSGEGIVLSNTATALWLSVHIASIVCAIVTVLYASKIMKTMWVALGFTLAFAFWCVVYVVLMIDMGFFGQWSTSRPLVFSYDSVTNTYAVEDVVAGNSSSVKVPASFNGCTVTQIKASVLLNDKISDYYLPAGVEVTALDGLENFDLLDRTVRVDKEYANKFRETLYSYQTNHIRARNNAVTLANSVIPDNLSGNEGYVCFNYPVEAYRHYIDNAIPVYVGDLTTFDLNGYVADFDYIAHPDDGSVENLRWAMSNGGYIYSNMTADGGEVADNVNKSTVVQLNFEKVYAVVVGAGNDLKYDLTKKQPAFCNDTVAGVKYPRMTTIARADKFFDGFVGREGFSVEWRKGVETIENFAKVLSDLPGNAVEIEPYWTLEAPQLTLSSTAENNQIVYGDRVTLSPAVELKAEGVSLNYYWTKGFNSVPSINGSVILSKPGVSESGDYTLRVTAGDDDVTSLTASVTKTISLNITPREIDFVWRLPEETLVYDGWGHDVLVTFDEAQAADGDTVQYLIVADHLAMVDQQKHCVQVLNAREYSVGISLYGESEKNYTVSASSSATIKVEKKKVAVEWQIPEKIVYSGKAPEITPYAEGIGYDGNVAKLSGSYSPNAGTYTATAESTNSNYVLENATHPFTIERKPLTVTPSMYTATYGEDPVVNESYGVQGLVLGDSFSSLLGKPVHTFHPAVGDADYKAGEYPEGVTLSGLYSNNYDITFKPAQLIINKRYIEVSWSGYKDLVYNGQPKNLVANITNKVDGDDVRLTTVNTDKVEAGSYFAIVTGMVGEDADNYYKNDNYRCDYLISKANVMITADNKTSAYGDEQKVLTYSVDGTIYNDELSFVMIKTPGNDVGRYAITPAALKTNSNYNVTLKNGIYEITKRVVNITWSGSRFVYNGTEKEVVPHLANMLDSEMEFVTYENVNDATPNNVSNKLSAINAGNYTATVKFSSAIADNYIVLGATHQWSIEKAATIIQLTVNGDTLGSGASEISLNLGKGSKISWWSDPAAVVALVHGDNRGTLAGDSYTVSEAGEYEITFIAGDDNHELVKRTLYITVRDAQDLQQGAENEN